MLKKSASNDLEKTRGSDRKTLRRENALKRFSVLSYEDWLKAYNTGDYESYVARKDAEKASLMASLSRG